MGANRWAWGVLLSLATTSCGSGAPEIPPELLEREPVDSGAYPAGPYGIEEGDTIENFAFQGYASPEDDSNLSEITFEDFHDPNGEKGIRLLLLNTAAAWCQPCAIEHEDLPSRVDELEERGLAVFSMLYQTADNQPADLETLDTWIATFDTNFPMAIDPSFQMGTFGSSSPPLNLVIDPTNMTLLRTFVGNQEGPMWEFVESELEARAETQ